MRSKQVAGAGIVLAVVLAGLSDGGWVHSVLLAVAVLVPTALGLLILQRVDRA